MGRILKPVSKISGIHGQPGEERVAQELANNLPNSYVILNSPRIHYKGETVDIDHIVIGPNGIFAIESKNMMGKISGGLMGNWLQEKRRAGKKIKIKIGNPSTQVNQYGKVIHTFLTVHYNKNYQSKININLYPIVVFAFDNIDLSKLEYTEPGMVGRARILVLKELCQQILSIKDVEYTTEEIEKIADIIIPADQRDQTGIFSSLEMSAVKEKFADRYEIYEEIGRGNFAIVYRGFDFKLDREVAVKKLLNHKSDKDTIQRFFREAQINSKLQHDSIVSIYDFYEEDGECYLIMEFVEGETILDLVQTKNLTIKEILEIMDSICSAVHHAHELNIIHRDLKPANILINLENKVKVTDFGIARLIEGPMLTHTHTSIGTPTIMAPEQVTGKEIDSRTDIFSLGVLMYFMCTGNYPFLGEHIGEVIHKILYLDPIPPCTATTDMPKLVEKIILKALEKDPDMRFQSVEEMRQAILYAISPDLAQDATIGLILEDKNNLPFIKSITRLLRTFFSNDKRKFMAITLVTIMIFGSIIFSQSYFDNKNSVNNEINNRALGFNNENIPLLYQDPNQYDLVPINLIGKIDRIINDSDNSVLFRLSIEPSKDPKNKTILVSARGAHFLFANLQYIRVVGLVATQSSPYTQNNNAQSEPVIIADKIDAIQDPWYIISPTKTNLLLNKSVDQHGQVLTIKRIEFASDETRLFIGAKNNTDKVTQFNLDLPRAKQGSKDFKELKNHYGSYSRSKFNLDPGQEIEEVIFLEPLNPRTKNATISMGLKNTFVFDINWE